MLTLVIGNKAYSSWSLRAWLALDQTGLAFEEILVPLSQPGSRAELLKHSPAGLVPVLKHDRLIVWESLAIIEYLAELCPAARLWPDDRAARAHSRSIAAEMHAGFRALRLNMPMNLRKSLPGLGMTPEVDQDVRRITAIWRACRSEFGDGGPYLFGAFSAADAMYAPVATRFRTYGVALDPVSAAYVEAIHDQPAFRVWQDAAFQEPWVIEEDEVT